MGNLGETLPLLYGIKGGKKHESSSLNEQPMCISDVNPVWLSIPYLAFAERSITHRCHFTPSWSQVSRCPEMLDLHNECRWCCYFTLLVIYDLFLSLSNSQHFQHLLPCRLFLESTLHTYTYICHQEIYGQHLIYVTVLSHIVRPAFQLNFDAVLEVMSVVAFGQAVF